MTKEEFVALKVGDVLENLDGAMRVRLVEHVGFVWGAVHVGKYMTGSETYVSAYELWRKLPAPEAEEKLPPGECVGRDCYGNIVRVGDTVANVRGERVWIVATRRGLWLATKHETGCAWPEIVHAWTLCKDVPGPVGNLERRDNSETVALKPSEEPEPTEAGAVCAECKVDLAVCDRYQREGRPGLRYCRYCYYRESHLAGCESGPGIGTVEPVVDVEGECWERPGWES